MRRVFLSNKFKKVIVHSGPFHADDALCVAMLRLWGNPDIEICRLPKVEEEYPEDTIICDIGGKTDGAQWFDHHQLDYSEMSTEEKQKNCRCAAELLFEAYGALDCKEIRNYLHEISMHDTGVRLCEVGWIYRDLQPAWDESISMDEAFMKAVALAEQILKRKEELYHSRRAAEAEYGKAYQNKIGRTLILDTFIPWQEYATEDGDEVRRAIMTGREPGQCNLVVKRGRTLPEGWNPEGMVFIHAARFMAVFESKEAAINAAKSLDSDLSL